MARYVFMENTVHADIDYILGHTVYIKSKSFI